MQKALFPAKDKQSCHSRHGISQACCNGRPADSHVKDGNQRIIKGHVQNSSRHRANQRKTGLFAGDHIKGKIIHQKDGHGENQITAQIFHTVPFHLCRQLHSGKNMIHCQIPCPAHNDTHNHICQNQKGKIFLCLPAFLLPHFFHNDRAAAGGKHGGDGCDKLDDGRRQIDCGERAGSDQV